MAKHKVHFKRQQCISLTSLLIPLQVLSFSSRRSPLLPQEELIFSLNEAVRPHKKSPLIRVFRNKIAVLIQNSQLSLWETKPSLTMWLIWQQRLTLGSVPCIHGIQRKHAAQIPHASSLHPSIRPQHYYERCLLQWCLLSPSASILS